MDRFIEILKARLRGHGPQKSWSTTEIIDLIHEVRDKVQREAEDILRERLERQQEE